MQCVREQSATFGLENVGLAVDHFGLSKFATRDEGYRSVLSKLVEITTPLSRTIKHHYAVPVETVETYTHRYELSTPLEAKLQTRNDKASVPHAVAIHGLGSSGKSQLALSYAEARKQRFNPVLWIDATDAEAVRSSFERCATELEITVIQTETAGPILIAV
jgi:hypothetical protein